jgi:hypothetical protein
LQWQFLRSDIILMFVFMLVFLRERHLGRKYQGQTAVLPFRSTKKKSTKFDDIRNKHLSQQNWATPIPLCRHL